MKLVIHVGMHKTGSSSIQNAFARVEDPAFLHLPWAGANHTGLFVLLFEEPEKAANFHGFRHQGRTVEDMVRLRRTWSEKVETALRTTPAETVLLSAEAISGPFEEATRRLATFAEARFDEIEVIGYVRDPASYMASAFQEMVKGDGLDHLKPGPIWPHYRRAFAKLDRIFGRERVTLKPFDKARLVNASVVDDFAREIGVVPAVCEGGGFDNAALSLEATALLFMQRKLGDGFVAGFPGAHRCNAAFVERLASIGGTRFAFSPAFVAKASETFAEDLAWMETRLGEAFPPPAAGEGEAITGEDDLLAVALRQGEEVLSRLTQALEKARSEPEGLADALSLLRRLSYREEGGEA